MKKEIEVYIHPSINDEQDDGYHAVLIRKEHRKEGWDKEHNYLSATLIIDLPEKRIEISESEFDEAWKESREDTNPAFKTTLKNKLFSKAQG